jgi:hypothetical protein
VTCTFTNVRRSSIIIVKKVFGRDATFSFTGAQSFSILTSGGAGSDTTTFASVTPGTYVVTEAVPAGWTLTGLACSNASTVNVATATANVAVAAGETAICTFTNTQPTTGIPTLSRWALIVLAMLLMMGGWVQSRRRGR